MRLRRITHLMREIPKVRDAADYQGDASLTIDVA